MGYGGKLMPRYHNVDNQKIQYTEAEELARDAEEQQWIDEAPAREAKSIQEARRDAYHETDGLFFKEQAGEVPVGTWATARAAVKIANPKG